MCLLHVVWGPLPCRSPCPLRVDGSMFHPSSYNDLTNLNDRLSFTYVCVAGGLASMLRTVCRRRCAGIEATEDRGSKPEVPMGAGKAVHRHFPRVAVQAWPYCPVALVWLPGVLGRAKLKVLPLPTALSTHIRPPWASTIPLEILNPRPAPPEFLDRDRSDRANL